MGWHCSKHCCIHTCLSQDNPTINWRRQTMPHAVHLYSYMSNCSRAGDWSHLSPQQKQKAVTQQRFGSTSKKSATQAMCPATAFPLLLPKGSALPSLLALSCMDIEELSCRENGIWKLHTKQWDQKSEATSRVAEMSIGWTSLSPTKIFSSQPCAPTVSNT